MISAIANAVAENMNETPRELSAEGMRVWIQ
jgi:hypothetical protein